MQARVSAKEVHSAPGRPPSLVLQGKVPADQIKIAAIVNEQRVMLDGKLGNTAAKLLFFAGSPLLLSDTGGIRAAIIRKPIDDHRQ